MPKAEGTKHDSDKVRLDLLPPYPLECIAEILTYGAQKYSPWNWTKGIHYSRLYRATLSHLFAWARGEILDPESGKPHLWHAGCNILFLIWHSEYRPDLNDIHPPSLTSIREP